MVATSMFTLLSFSSITCRRTVSASVSASAMVMSLLYCSCSMLVAPSCALPMEAARYFVKVPDGSVLKSTGPSMGSTPPTSRATPKGRDITRFLSLSESLKSRARSATACTQDSTGMRSLYVNQCACASTRAWSTSVRASAVRPLIAQPMCSSISSIFSMLEGSISCEVRRFSTASTTPSFVEMPMAVEPSLMASMAYSTWKSRPSGEKVFTPRSYSLRDRKLMACAQGRGRPLAGTRRPALFGPRLT
mmetsp:Transcript_8173/g.24020  ORF Transcript_8173/g.24020 Transcript_8173/m.24020 type:complete len:248 (-) Transcript_8173:8-751(-)